MSYILDALKKADAEREQGQVPGLNTTSYAQPELDDGPVRRTPAPWQVAVGALLVLTTLGAIWQWTRPAATVTVIADQAPAPLTPNPGAIQLPQPAQTAPAPLEPEVAPAAVTPVPPTVTAREVVKTPNAAPAAAPRKVTRTEPLMPPVAPSVTVPKSRAPLHVDPAAQPAQTAHLNRLPTLAELPDEVRRGLPNLSVSGAMYSDQPANRMLLINNRVFHEGDQPVAGLVLEEIRLKSAVFNFRGTRYAVSY